MWKVPGGIRLNEFFLGVSVQHIQRLAHIDSGKVRFVLREFPLDLVF